MAFIPMTIGGGGGGDVTYNGTAQVISGSSWGGINQTVSLDPKKAYVVVSSVNNSGGMSNMTFSGAVSTRILNNVGSNYSYYSIYFIKPVQSSVTFNSSGASRASVYEFYAE